MKDFIAHYSNRMIERITAQGHADALNKAEITCANWVGSKMYNFQKKHLVPGKKPAVSITLVSLKEAK